MTDEAGPDAARERALDLLARREHSCAELCQKLVHKGFAASAETVVAELAQAGLVSDQRYAEALEEYRRAHLGAPRDPAVLVTLADALARSGDMEGLVGAYERLVELTPGDPRAWTNLGAAWQRRGRRR